MAAPALLGASASTTGLSTFQIWMLTLRRPRRHGRLLECRRQKKFFTWQTRISSWTTRLTSNRLQIDEKRSFWTALSFLSPECQILATSRCVAPRMTAMQPLRICRQDTMGTTIVTCQSGRLKKSWGNLALDRLIWKSCHVDFFAGKWILHIRISSIFFWREIFQLMMYGDKIGED